MGQCLPKTQQGDEQRLLEKYEPQHLSIQKLQTMIRQLDDTYNYYAEQTFINQARAIAYQEEGHDTNRALHYLKITQQYEQNKQTISNLQILLINMELKLRTAVETSKTLELIKDESASLDELLRKIYDETKVIQTLNALEANLDKVNRLDSIMENAATKITERDKEELQTLCKNRYQLLKDHHQPDNYYSNLLEQEKNPAGIMDYIESIFVTPTKEKQVLLLGE